jgi:hypothetical protein
MGKHTNTAFYSTSTSLAFANLTGWRRPHFTAHKTAQPGNLVPDHFAGQMLPSAIYLPVDVDLPQVEDAELEPIIRPHYKEYGRCIEL